MDHYTKSITLTETTDAEFERRKEFWGRTNLRVGKTTLLTVVENPFSVPLTSADPVDDYVTLFERIFEHYCSPKLCIRTSAGWNWYSKKQLGPSDLRTLAGIASAQQPKQYYLEVRFFRRDFEQTAAVSNPLKRPVIEFTESVVNGSRAIVGYQVCFPVQYQELFTLRTSRQDFTLVHGFWVP